MPLSWITLYPGWYVQERQLLSYHYPAFRVDQARLQAGILTFYGELVVRPQGGTKRYPVYLTYPQATPYEHPIVVPLEQLPDISDDGIVSGEIKRRFFDRRHQMPTGALCLFQRETRSGPSGDLIRGIDALRRAEQWLLGLHTGHWPPDSVNSEMEAHFSYYSDVLLGDACFEVKPGQYGQFWLVPDLRRFAEGRVRDVYPFIATAFTIENTGIVTVHDARCDLAHLFPWIDTEAWEPTQLALPEVTDKLRKIGLERGYWWYLPEEPQPFHDGASLLALLTPIAPDEDAWRMVSDTLKSDLSLVEKHFIGLCYPRREGGVEWLVLVVLSAPYPATARGLIHSEQDKRRRFEAAQIASVHVHSVRPAELRLRNQEVIAPTVATKTVALIGLGALGSTVADLLAKAGVGKFLLCDMDILSIGNVARHVGGLHEFGARKVHVVGQRLWEINPYLEFGPGDVLNSSATTSLDDLSAFLAEADLIVSTVADENVESAINQIAVLLQKPVLYGRAIRRGSMGRVFLVRPQFDACKQCLAEYASAGRSGTSTPADWVDIQEDGDEPILHECGRPVIPASAADLTFVSALIARVALDFLEGKELTDNHWIWSYAPAPDVEQRLDRALSTFSGRLPVASSCPVCREPAVMSVVIPEALHADILAMVESMPEAETGGTLVGYVDKERQAVINRVIGPGPTAIQEPTLFARDVEYTQVELDRAAQELGEHGVYLGEWHSHLVPVPHPSPTDIESLSGISSAPHYLNRCPVMIIAGLDVETGKVAEVGAWSFPVGGRIYEIHYTVSSEKLTEDPD